jgi:hypothetical protein
MNNPIIQRLLLVVAYFVCTGIGIYIAHIQLIEKMNLHEIPTYLYLSCGPMIAAANGHGAEIYVVVTAVILPLLTWAIGSDRLGKWTGITLAISVWVGVGYWMSPS